MSLNNKKVKLSKKELEKLAEAIKDAGLKTEIKKELKNIKLIEENKFITPDLARVMDNLNFSLPRSRSETEINLEKTSPVLKPVAKTQEGLEQITSSFLLQKSLGKTEKPYESEKQGYFSQSSEYKTIDKIQTENLQTPAGVEKGITHMGVVQSTKRKSQSFFDEKSEKEYKNFLYDKPEKM